MRSIRPIACGAAGAGARFSDRPRCRILTPIARGPGSRRFVQHLGGWYAQAHPTEDFAETFAVWLKPRSAWRREYAGWPALAKLEFIDAAGAGRWRSTAAGADRSRIEDVADETAHPAPALRAEAGALSPAAPLGRR